MQNLSNILVWKKSMELVTEVYQASAKFPNDEKFGLTSQIRRCSVSIPSNIAEGAGRNSSKEFNQFLGIASGSAFEMQTQLIIASNLGYCSDIEKKKLNDKTIEIQKMIYSFQNTLTAKH